MDGWTGLVLLVCMWLLRSELPKGKDCILFPSLLPVLAQLLMHSKVKSLSCVRFFVTPWIVAHQAPPSMGFSRQEYWSGLPFPMHSKGSINAHQMHEWSELLLLMTDVLPVTICQSTVFLST